MRKLATLETSHILPNDFKQSDLEKLQDWSISGAVSRGYKLIGNKVILREKIMKGKVVDKYNTKFTMKEDYLEPEGL